MRSAAAFLLAAVALHHVSGGGDFSALMGAGPWPEGHADLTFVREHTGIEPSALHIADVDAPVVLCFLQYLEQQRGNSVRSRNIRLAAIRSFCRLVALREPESIGIVTRVLAIPMKREDRNLIASLTPGQAHLAYPVKTWKR